MGISGCEKITVRGLGIEGGMAGVELSLY
jgi:hypothetical protein